MDATVLLSSRCPSPPLKQDDDLTIAFDAPANDGAAAGRLGPEEILVVSFEGLTEEEAERALAAFAGGRRMILVTH
jgi:hypothetical protein